MDQRQLTTALPRLLIRLYQAAMAGTPRRCRFYPTCSDYARQALSANGLWKGLGLSALRILKCHPWHPGGYNPVDITTP